MQEFHVVNMKEFKFFQKEIPELYHPSNITGFFDRMTYNEGWICGMEQCQNIPTRGCPYDLDTPAREIWVMGYMDSITVNRPLYTSTYPR